METQGVLASLTQEQMNQLCELLAAKLGDRQARVPASQAGRRGFESRRPLQCSQSSKNGGVSRHRHLFLQGIVRLRTSASFFLGAPSSPGPTRLIADRRRDSLAHW